MYQNKNETNQDIKIIIKKKYLCECTDCVGEWTGLYENTEDIEKDIKIYCRSGKATFKILEE